MKNHPFIIAHRGWSGRYLENTSTAIRAAAGLGVDFVEVDVNETKDGEVVVFHDYGLHRICGVRKRVRDTTLAEMKRLNPDIPTLAEAMRICRGKARVLIEVKRADPKKVAAVITRCRMTRHIIVFSLSIPTVRQCADADPQLVRFALFARRLRTSLPALRSSVRVQGLGLSRRLVKSKDVVRQLHRRGWKLFVWTVNRPSEMRRLMEWGVDGLITDHPDLAKSCLARR